jgi:chromosomal replication initiation ATPase DnaA
MPETSRSGGKVQVHVRVRPRSDPEHSDQRGAVTLIGANSLQVEYSNNDTVSEFVFDSVLDEKATQADLQAAVGKPMVQHVLSGYHGCCFAYGQTGSGKTFSMYGKVSSFFFQTSAY